MPQHYDMPESLVAVVNLAGQDAPPPAGVAPPMAPQAALPPAPPGGVGMALPGGANVSSVDMRKEIERQLQEHPEKIAELAAEIRASGITEQEMQMLTQLAIAAVDNPSIYPQLRQFAIQKGLASEQDLPAEYDQGLVFMFLLASASVMQGGQQGQAQPQGGAGASFASGGALPEDSLNPDGSIPIVAHEGEYVIPKDAVMYHGTKALGKLVEAAGLANPTGESGKQSMRTSGLVKSYKDGGEVHEPPWDIRPTPDPDLPEAQDEEEKIRQIAERAAAQRIGRFGGRVRKLANPPINEETKTFSTATTTPPVAQATKNERRRAEYDWEGETTTYDVGLSSLFGRFDTSPMNLMQAGLGTAANYAYGFPAGLVPGVLGAGIESQRQANKLGAVGIEETFINPVSDYFSGWGGLGESFFGARSAEQQAIDIAAPVFKQQRQQRIDAIRAVTAERRVREAAMRAAIHGPVDREPALVRDILGIQAGRREDARNMRESQVNAYRDQEFGDNYGSYGSTRTPTGLQQGDTAFGRGARSTPDWGLPAPVGVGTRESLPSVPDSADDSGGNYGGYGGVHPDNVWGPVF